MLRDQGQACGRRHFHDGRAVFQNAVGRGNRSEQRAFHVEDHPAAAHSLQKGFAESFPSVGNRGFHHAGFGRSAQNPRGNRIGQFICSQ